MPNYFPWVVCSQDGLGGLGFYGNTQIELAWTDIRDRHGVNALTRVEPIDGKGYFSLIEVS